MYQVILFLKIVFSIYLLQKNDSTHSHQGIDQNKYDIREQKVGEQKSQGEVCR